MQVRCRKDASKENATSTDDAVQAFALTSVTSPTPKHHERHNNQIKPDPDDTGLRTTTRYQIRQRPTVVHGGTGALGPWSLASACDGERAAT
ncbi:hypothetical protein U9M48_001903 [Paspalum notatum var. saurae]|uniref:Uncharacterized protein n=1 Tax=Paspalum notatum var. saurae TaxID=547442 RepID=A0AAQ3SFJ5_PASNO